MPRRVSQSQAIDEIRAMADRFPDQTLWIGIDGFGAAGKSTFAARTAQAVARAVVISVDDFSGPHVQQWDWARLRREVVDPIEAGRPARYRRWDWAADAPAEWHDVPAGSVVIVEGVSSTRAEAAIPWNLQVWVDAPQARRRARALERDGEVVMRRWLEHWIPSEEAYAARERPHDRVDLVVSGSE